MPGPETKRFAPCIGCLVHRSLGGGIVAIFALRRPRPTQTQMIDGLALDETTPGPLIS